MIRFVTAGAILLGLAAVAHSQPAPETSTVEQQPARNTDDSKILCKYVVSAARGAKPYRMCMSKSDWALKDARDQKDANRIVCKYQEDPASPLLRGYKICQPASEWAEQERLAREHIDRIQMMTPPPH